MDADDLPIDGEFDLEHLREAEELSEKQEERQQKQHQQQQQQGNTNANTQTQPRVHTLTSMSGAPFESKADPNNPTALRIIDMAKQLGIDPSSEFYLLTIAMHALSSPQEWTRVSDSETYEKARTDIRWFKDLVETERNRFRKTPSENSPWVKIKDSPPQPITTDPTMHAPAHAAAAASSTTTTPAPSSRSYYYNFKTFRSASTLPPAKKDLAPPVRVEKQELDVMRFTSFWVEGNTKRYVKIHYYLSAEEFEIHLVSNDPTAATAEQRAENPSQIYRVKSIKTKHGPASCWDLHLKATLDIFGRPTTLLQCDSATRIWIETNARRLLKVRTMLEKKLAKYENINEKRRANVPLVEYHLRSLMKDVARLKNRFTSYRPSLAEKYAL